MEESINEITEALRRLRKLDPWSPDIKVTDDFLDPLFRDYFEKLGYPNMLRKSDYHVLAGFLTKEDLDPEILEKLDAIQRVAEQARPVEEDLA